MPAVHPDTQALLALIRASGRPPFEALSPGEARRAYAASRAVLQPEPDHVAETRDLVAPAKAIVRATIAHDSDASATSRRSACSRSGREKSIRVPGSLANQSGSLRAR